MRCARTEEKKVGLNSVFFTGQDLINLVEASLSNSFRRTIDTSKNGLRLLADSYFPSCEECHAFDE